MPLGSGSFGGHGAVKRGESKRGLMLGAAQEWAARATRVLKLGVRMLRDPAAALYERRCCQTQTMFSVTLHVSRRSLAGAYRDAIVNFEDEKRQGWFMLKKPAEGGNYTFTPGDGDAGSDGNACDFKFHVSIDPTRLVDGAAIVLDVLSEHMDIVNAVKIQNPNCRKFDKSGKDIGALDFQPSKQVVIHWQTPDRKGPSCPTAKVLEPILTKIDEQLSAAKIGVHREGVNSDKGNIVRGKFDRIVKGKEGATPGRFAYRNTNAALQDDLEYYRDEPKYRGVSDGVVTKSDGNGTILAARTYGYSDGPERVLYTMFWFTPAFFEKHVAEDDRHNPGAHSLDDNEYDTGAADPYANLKY